MAQTGTMGGSLTIAANGPRLRALRRDRKLKQLEVEKEAGLPRLRLTQYEASKPAPIEHLLKLGRFFGCEGRELADPEALRINKSLLLDLVEFHGATLVYGNGADLSAPAEPSNGVEASTE